MKTTIKTLITAALAGASALAISAGAAQADDDRRDHRRYDGRYEQNRYDQSRYDRDDHHYGRQDDRNINARQRQVERRIERGLERGSISRWEANRLIHEFRQLAYLENRYRQNGLSGWERADLDRRFDRLEAQVRFENNDRNYGYGYGRR